MAATSDRTNKLGGTGASTGEKRLEGSADCVTMKKPYTHYGSIKHDNRGCWKGLYCHKRGRKGHISDKCMRVCVACGEIHDGSKFTVE